MDLGVRTSVAIIAFSGALWGTSFVAIKIGLKYVDPYSFALLRMAAAFIFASLLFMREHPRLDMLRTRSILGLGALNAGGFLLQYVGMTYTTASRTALIVNSNVAFTAVLGWSFNNDPMGVAQAAALPMAVLGICLLTTGGDISTLAGGQLTGDLLVLLAGLLWSFFLTLNKRVVSSKDCNVSQMVTWVTLVTAMGILPFSFTLGDLGRIQIPWQGWIAIAYTAVFCTILPYALFSRGQRHVTLTLSALVLLIEVVVAFMSSALLLGERLAAGNTIGAILVCVSIILASKGSDKRWSFRKRKPSI